MRNDKLYYIRNKTSKKGQNEANKGGVD